MSNFISLAGKIYMKRQERAKKNKNKEKKKEKGNFVVFLILLIGVPETLLILFVAMLMVLTGAYIYGEDSVRFFKEKEVRALAESISIAKLDFYKLLDVYIDEEGSFDGFNRRSLDKYIENYEEKYQAISEKNISFKYKYKGIVFEGPDDFLYYSWYFPIAKGYKASYRNSYGDLRTYQSGGGTKEREHKGIDIFCKEGTPIVAVESGEIKYIGWNDSGGWRITITSSDGERIWFYAHMRKDHPYAGDLKIGDEISAGQVIGYVGSTGYANGKLAANIMPGDVASSKVVDGKFEEHLHIDVKLTSNMTHYNAFPILRLIEPSALRVSMDSTTNEYVSTHAVYRFSYNILESDIGSLAKKYESNGDPGAISNTPGDIGGKSYGAFQFVSSTSVGNVVGSFVTWLEDKDKLLFNSFIEAIENDGGIYGENFDALWDYIADEKEEYFYNLQYNYVLENYYDNIAEQLFNKGIDIDGRSTTLKAAILSTSIHLGPGNAIEILNNVKWSSSDENIINSIYNQRLNRVNNDFRSSTEAIRSSIRSRLHSELNDAIDMLLREGF